MKWQCWLDKIWSVIYRHPLLIKVPEVATSTCYGHLELIDGKFGKILKFFSLWLFLLFQFLEYIFLIFFILYDILLVKVENILCLQNCSSCCYEQTTTLTNEKNVLNLNYPIKYYPRFVWTISLWHVSCVQMMVFCVVWKWMCTVVDIRLHLLIIFGAQTWQLEQLR